MTDKQAKRSESSADDNSESAKQLLWHYTPIGKLPLILENGLYAWDAKTLQDTKECKLADQARALLIEVLPLVNAKFKKGVNGSLTARRVEGKIQSGELFQSFVACFCTNWKSHYMWEQFKKGEKMCAIGFRRKDIENLANNQKRNSQIVVGECKYGAFDLVKGQLEFAEKILKYTSLFFSSIPEGKKAAFGRLLQSEILQSVSNLTCTKDLQYYVEEEFRIVRVLSEEQVKTAQTCPENARRFVPILQSDLMKPLIQQIIVKEDENEKENVAKVMNIVSESGLPESLVVTIRVD